MNTISRAVKTALFGTAIGAFTPIYAFAADAEQLPERQVEVSSVVETNGPNQEEMERVEIIGSRVIKDPKMTTRSFDVFNRDDIDRMGASSLEDFLRRIPQNINAGTSTGSGLGPNSSNFGAGPNAYGGSSVNLRGLGARYTLVLIDGRRPARGGVFGDVTDISTIPLERVESVEIMYDGAAAIYGSDAVGGVININTRQDFSGTDVSLSYDIPKDDGGEALNFSIGHTFDLDDGFVSVSAGIRQQNEISTSQRDIPLSGLQQRDLPIQRPGVIGAQQDFVSNNLAPFMFINDETGERISGSERVTYQDGDFQCGPDPVADRCPNIVSFFAHRTEALPSYIQASLTPQGRAAVEAARNAANGLRPVYYANLPEFNGARLGLNDVIVPDGSTPEEQYAGLGPSLYPLNAQTLAPEQENLNAAVTFQYDLTTDLTLNVNTAWAHQETTSLLIPHGNQLGISSYTPSNPFFTPVGYAVDYGLGQETNKVETNTFNFNVSLDWDLNEDWTLQLNANRSEQEAESRFLNSLYEGRTTVDGTLISLEELDEMAQNGEIGTLRSRAFGGDAISYQPAPNEDGTLPPREQVYVTYPSISFHDPLLGYESIDDLRKGVINPFYRTATETTMTEVELFAIGRLLTLPAGDVTTTVNLSRREETTDTVNNNNNINLGSSFQGINSNLFSQNFDTAVNALGAEISVPVVGNKNSFVGVDSLAFHGALRVENVNYMEENAENWSVGFNYRPISWATLRVNRANSKALPTPMLALGNVTLNLIERPPLSGVNDTPTDLDDTIDGNGNPRTGNNLWAIGGPAGELGPEISEDLVVGLQLTPWENFEFEVTYTSKDLDSQISTPGIGNVSIEDLNNADRGLTQYLERVTEATTVLGQQFTTFRYVPDFGAPFFPIVGDYVADQRNFNIQKTEVENLDFQLSFGVPTKEMGSFYFTWTHNVVLTNNVTQNTVCSALSEGCEYLDNETNSDLRVDEAVSILRETDRRATSNSVLLDPIPKFTGALQFDWAYKGLNLGLTTQYRDSTSIVNDASGFVEDNGGERVSPVFRVKTTPALGLDINASYEFNGGLFDTPQWLDTTTVYLTINDALRRDEKVDIIWEDPALELENDRAIEMNFAGIEPRGTTVNLRIRTLF